MALKISAVCCCGAPDPRGSAPLAGSTTAIVRDEIEALHAFFVGWFSGSLGASEFESGFLARFAPDFLLIPPAGTLLDLAQLSDAVRSAHGTNPIFRIAIRNVTIRRQLDGHILATYEEWQRNALASTPPDNGRVATVLFRDGRPLQWLHIHETWLPESIARAGPYDF
jgi:hypothetical protein